MHVRADGLSAAWYCSKIVFVCRCCRQSGMLSYSTFSLWRSVSSSAITMSCPKFNENNIEDLLIRGDIYPNMILEAVRKKHLWNLMV